MSNQRQLDDKQNIKQAVKTAESPSRDTPITLAEINQPLTDNNVTRMQQTVGNTAAQRIIAQRSGDGQAEVDDDIANNIHSQRGSGQTINDDIAAKAGGVMGHDLSNVRVHTDSNADTLSRQLNAKAFTTGNDIFFQQGAYNPTSSEGQHLISHELTHVVQQGASVPSVQGKLSVNDPNDQYEAEADHVADMVMSSPDIQRQGDFEEEDEGIQRQEMAEDDEMIA
jgi:hypothetical protein